MLAPNWYGIDTVEEWLEIVVFMAAIILVAGACLIYAALMAAWNALLAAITLNPKYLSDIYDHHSDKDTK